MMAEFRWIHLSVILMLQLTGAHSGDLLLSFTVRDGDKVTLPCKNVINNHHNCDTTTWLFIDSRGKAAVELVNLGQIKEKAKSDRLSVTAECSLVIKKVTAEDVGRYTCRQFRGNPGKQQGLDAVVHLSVVIVTEQKKADQLTLNCSVQVYGRCKYKVKWIHNSVALDRDHSKFKTSQSSCSATVTFLKLQYSQISSSDFKCNITTEENKKQLFTFSTRSSGAALVWPYILVAVISAALLIFAVKLIVLKRGNKTQANENVDHEDGVSYISISYTNKAYSENKVWGKCDSDEIVTYSTVKASSTDPSSLYATIK
ncbi:uncharacterized protein LOC109194855 isoform X2 [Oreochromis niloticus]|uniref:uncharacterized protein LOC109194855 isoform X2 n=1 Tax=Oreochromis niloticus TaxID=8128 RepID=UPI000DF23775|nr:uncharacterized protein LOC109194855 isoform X2 [Oreochromis niloticus]